MASRWCFCVLLAMLWVSNVFAAPSGFVYQGQIIKPTGQPLEDLSVDFRVQILSPGSEACVLYEETHTLNMQNSNGVFAIEVGSGARSGGDFEDTATLASAVDNSTGVVSPDICAVGSTYTPSLSDSRKLQVSFDSGLGAVTLDQPLNIVSVPFAMSASSLDGFGSSSFVQVNTSLPQVLSQANLEWVFESTRFSELQALINGTSTQYAVGTPTGDVDMNGQAVVNVGNPSNGTDATNKTYVDSNIAGLTVNAAVKTIGLAEDGQVLTWDGVTGEWITVAPAAAPVDSVFGRTGAVVAAASDYDANQIDNTPYNDIAATDVQAAVNELQDEKVAKAGDNMSGSLQLDNESELRLEDTTNNRYVGFKAPTTVTAASSFVWTLPADDGAPNEVLQTNGSGVLQWTALPAGDVTGADNVGAGAGQIFRDETSGTLNLKTIAAGSGSMIVTNNANDVSLDIADGGVDTTELADDAVTAAKLADTAVTAGSYGSATQVATFTVDAQGRLTAAGNTTITESDPKMQTLSSGEVDQLENIDTVTISNTQWGYLGAMTGQPLESETQSLDDAYDNGSSVTVDNTDVVWNLTSTNDFIVQDNGTTSFIVDDSGKVGIGTATPQSTLHLNSGASTSLRFGTDTLGYGGMLYTNSDAVDAMGLCFGDMSSGCSGIQHVLQIFNNGNAMQFGRYYGIAFWSGFNQERMRLDGSGNLGIGTATPNHLLDVEGNIGLNAGGYLNFGDADGITGYGLRDNAGTIEYKDSGGSWSSFASAAGDITAVNTNSGSGLSGGAGNGDVNLQVVVDDASVEIATNTIQVKDLGITTAKIADDAVTAAKLADTAVTAGSYGSATQVATFTVDAQGRLTAAGNTAITESDPKMQTLTSGEVDQLENIDAVTISNTQWGYLGAMTGQPLESEIQSLNDAYDNGSNVTIDSTDVIWNLTSTNDFIVQDNGTTSFIVNDSGNVGVGTSSPTSNLHVHNETSNVTATLRSATGQTSLSMISFDGDNFQMINNGAISTLTSANSLHLQHTGNANASFFGYSPNGTTRSLSIAGYRTGDSLRTIQISVGKDAIDTATFDNISNYYFEGNMGVGDFTPDHKLDVEGNLGIQASGYLNFGDADGTTGYGLRDNAGTIEFKDSGGSWSSFAAAAGDITAVNTNSGSGLSGGAASGDATLQVVVDDASVEIATNTIQVKDLGITTAKIADDAVTSAKLADTAVTAGSYGSATQVATFTVDAQGRLTAAGNTTITESDPKMQTLTIGEVDQLENIDAVTISNTQWGYLGAMTGQPLESEIQSLDDAYNNGSSVTVDSTDVVWNLTGTNDFLVQDNGTTSFIVDDSGNVGVGTSNPSGPFHVYKSIASGSATLFQAELNGGANTPRFNIDLDEDNAKVKLRANGSATPDMAFGNNSTDYVTIKAGGDVGIGTVTPNHLLDVEGNIGLNAGGYLNFGDADGTAGYGLRDNAGTIEFKDSGGSWSSFASAAGDITAVNTNSGSGLSGGTTSGDATLQVVVDDASVEIATNTIQVKNLGVTTAKIADDAVTAAKLANTTVTAGSYGSATQVATFTVDAQGRLTAAGNTPIDPGLQTLTSGEVDQLENINSVTISNTQWGYLGAMSGQPLESETQDLDDAYNNGSSVTVDSTDMIWNLAGINNFEVQDNGVTSFIVENTGMVGIGTTNPDDALDIQVSSSSLGVRITDTGTGNGIQLQGYQPAINFNQYWDGANTRAIGPGYTGQFVLNADTGNFHLFSGNNPGSGAIPTNTNHLIVTNSGNFGFGTTSPGAHVEFFGGGRSLYLNQPTVADLFMSYHVPTITYWTTGPKSNGDFWFSQSSDHNSQARMVLSNGGNVGIGTASPGDALHVQGKIRAEQICYTDGSNCKDISTAWTGGGGSVTSVTAGTGLDGGTITGAGTIDLADTAVTAGSYGSASQAATFTVDAQGRLTAAGNTPIDPGLQTLTSGEVDQLENINSVTISNTQWGYLGAMSGQPLESETQDLDDAYNNGSSVTVDSTDMIWNLTSSNDFIVQDNGTTSFIVDDSGNVGVGTNTPSAKLEVRNDSTGANLIRVKNTNSSGKTGLYLSGDTGDFTKALYAVGSTGGTAAYPNDSLTLFNTDGDIQLAAGSAPVDVVIKPSGNVGIGSLSPSAKLDVNGEIKVAGRIIAGHPSSATFDLGNQDWSNLIASGTATYDAAENGMRISGSGTIQINTRIPVEEGATYRAEVTFKKISGSGGIYIGAHSLDGNFSGITTDLATSYNYFAAQNAVLAVGNEQTFVGYISGYNTTGTGDHKKFDPEAQYFNLVLIANYSGSGDSVVKSVHIEKVSGILADASGNVGIGTTTPGDSLHVEGNIRAEQICYTDGTNCKDISTAWTGGGGSVTSVGTGSGLTGGPITGSGVISVATGGITETHLASNSVNTSEVIDNSLTAADLAADSVGASELANNSVASANIIDGAVALADLAANSVNSSKVVDGSITSADVAANTLTAADLAADSVGASELANNSVASANIINGSIQAADIAALDNSLTFAAANGRGVKYWGSDNHKTYMSAQGDATWGGRLDSTSDYNMYFLMTGGTNRGFVFKNGTTVVGQIDGGGNVYATSFIGDGSGLTNIGAAALGANSVGSSEVIDNSLTAADLAAGSVGTSEVANNSLTASDLAADSVGASELANNSVASANIIDGAVALADLAANSVDSSKIVDSSITGTDIAANTITAADIATNGVGAAEIAAGAVGTSEVADNSLTASDLAADSVGASELANNSVASANIIDGAVALADLAANSVNSSKIVDSSITGADVAANTLTAADLAANSVGASELANNSVDSAAIINGTITTSDLASSITNGLWSYSAGNAYRSSGNVGIGTATPGSLLTVAGPSESTNSGSVIHYENLADYYIGTSSVTGTMKITMPKTWSNTMMTVVIRGYNYLGGMGAWEVILSGYNYTPSTAWVNTSVKIEGKPPFSTVRLAHDGTKNIILLGTLSTTWNYAHVSVTDMWAGYSNSAGWGSGWTVGVISSEAGITGVNTPVPSLFTASTGNVGIGTTNPASLLHVQGTIRAVEICDEGGSNCRDISTGWGPNGTVTSVGTGSGLTGGPITGSGVISVATGGITATHLAANSVNTSEVVNNSLTAADLAADSVGASELANNSVASANIIDASVALADLAANSVNSSKIVDSSITGADIAANTITAADIATNGVGAAEIAAGAVGTSEVADNSLTAADLAADSVGASELANNSVASANIIDGAVALADLAANSVNSSKIVDSSITGADVAANTLTAADLAADSVGASELANNSVASANIVNGTIQAADIAALNDNLSFAAANGRGVRYWASDNYKTYMSAQGDATWGGRLDSTSDYNMYFLMTGGTNRGFVFKNGTTAVGQIDGAGNVYATSFIGDGSGLTNIGAAALGANSVGTSEVINNSLTAADLAADSVGASELANNSVASANIIDGAVALADLATNSVNSSKIVDSSITGTDIAANTITAADIATNGVGAAEIAANAVGTSEVADNSLTAADLAADSVGASELANNSVASANIIDGAVALADLAANSVNSSKIVDSSITGADVAANTLTAADLAANSVGASELANNSVDSAAIVNGTITTSDLAASISNGLWTYLGGNVYRNSGFVGIGTTVPQQKFHVSGGSLRIDDANYPQLVFRNTGNTLDNKQWKFYPEPTTDFIGSVTNDADSAAAIWLRVKRNGTNINTVNFENGKVGIGTNEAAANLHVHESQANKSLFVDQSIVGTGNNVVATQYKTGIYNASSGWTRSNAPWQHGIIQAGTNSTAVDRFYVGRTGLSTSDFVVSRDGNVGVGTVNPSSKFHVYNGSTNGTYTTSGWQHTSDRRLKTEIVPVQDSLDKILRLEPKHFKFIDDPSEKRQIGFIAQEVIDIFPEVVSQNSEGVYSMVYGGLTSPLVGAVQEVYGLCQATDEDMQNIRLLAEQNKRDIASIKQENKTLKEKLESQQKQIDWLLKKVEELSK